jgi:L-fucose mutarotase/ribose pyranase (RbsD/FucU family)
MSSNWEEILKDRLQLYGHRNWLVIADSAYPAQSRQGIETIVADEEQTAVLDRVFAILRTCRHIKPRIYSDEELGFVHEQDAPGINSYREKLGSLLEGHEMCILRHEEIISRLDQVGERFRVLLIKSNMRIPYTSLFLELECRYWNTHAEERLRAAMRSGDRHTLAPECTGSR